MDPGNVGKGFCLKCKTPMMIDLPDEDRVRLLCMDCTKAVQEFVRASKGNPNRKRMVIMADKFVTRTK